MINAMVQNTVKYDILIVDDTPDNLGLLSQILEERGYMVRAVTNGHHALKSVEARLPDLILLDVKMPGMEGYEVCRRLKANKLSCNIPVIFVSAYGESTQKVHGFEVGAVDFITKPYDEQEVLARVQTHLRLRDLTERLEQLVLDRTKELDEYRKHLEDLVEKRTAELAVAKQQAESANSAKSDFLARMSHDIRTPLNAVIGLANIVLKSDLKDEQRDNLNKVQLAAGNLMQVINDILDFSKVEAGSLELTLAPFDLDQVMKHQAGLFGDLAAKKDLKLLFSVVPQVPRQLVGDAGRLAQVLTNLIGNAIKFTEQGQIVVNVDLDDAAPKKHARTTLKFSVRDTGIGIAADMIPTLFDPFTQAGGSLTCRHEGTGLGLTICRQLTKLMGGNIWAESTPGKGSTFSFTARLEIPMQMPESERPSLSQEQDALPIQRLSGRRVLLVEDSALSRDMAVALLEGVGLAVEIAENGQIAANKVIASGPENYDAVLMDIQMPVMDGYVATRQIRQWEAEVQDANHRSPIAGYRIPIIALTAHALKGEKEKCLAADMDDYLSKPLEEQDVYRVLLKWLSPSED